MNKFVSQPLDKQMNRQNFLSRVEKLEAKAAPQPSATIGNLSELSPDAGDQFAGTYYVVDQATGAIRGYLTATPNEQFPGFHLAFFDTNKNLQFGADADTGKLVAGGGDVTLGDDGTVMLDYLPLELRAQSTTYGDLYSSFVYAEGRNGGLIVVSNAKRGNTNLIVDGDFESGGLSNWDTTSYGGGGIEVVSDYKHDGSYSAHFYSVYEQTGYQYSTLLTPTPFAVTAGNTYLFQSHIDRSGIGTSTTAWVQYYASSTDAPGSTIGSDVLLVLDRETKAWQRCMGVPSVAPTGANYARIKIQVSGFTEVWIDDISFVDIESAAWMEGTTDGWDMHGKVTAITFNGAPVGFGAQKTLGIDQNRSTANSYNYQEQDVIIRNTLSLSQVLWDIKNAGDYTLTIYDWEGNTLKTVAVAGVTAGSADVVFDTADYVLPPGRYKIRMTKSSTAVTWNDYNSAADQLFTEFEIINQIRYDGSGFGFRAPMKLRYYPTSY